MCVVLQCHVFVQDGGERSIMMAPSATSLISAEAVRDNFGTLQYPAFPRFGYILPIIAGFSSIHS